MMKRVWTSIICFCCISFSLWGQTDGKGICFESGTWNELLQKAQSENKTIFVDVWASWCGPCKRLSKEVFTQPEVGEYFNSHFLCYKLQTDPSDAAMRKEADSLSIVYEIASLPTLLWLSPKGERMHSSVGYMDKDELLEMAKTAIDPERNTATMLRRWEEGDRSLQTGLVYFTVKRDSIQEFDEFYLQLSKEDKLNVELQSCMLFSIAFNPESRALQYIAAHREDIYLPDPEGDYWDKLLQVNLEDFFRKCNTAEEQKCIEQMYEPFHLPYLYSCRDKVNCLKLLRGQKYEEGFQVLVQMMENYTDYSFMHSILYNLGNMLIRGEMKEVTPPAELSDWVERYVAQMPDKPVWSAYYRLTAYSLLRDEEHALMQQQALNDALDSSKEDAKYIESMRKTGKQLVEATKR